MKEEIKVSRCVALDRPGIQNNPIPVNLSPVLRFICVENGQISRSVLIRTVKCAVSDYFCYLLSEDRLPGINYLHFSCWISLASSPSHVLLTTENSAKSRRWRALGLKHWAEAAKSRYACVFLDLHPMPSKQMDPIAFFFFVTCF